MEIGVEELYQRIGYLTVLAEKQADRIAQLERQAERQATQPTRPDLAETSTPVEEAPYAPARQPP